MTNASRGVGAAGRAVAKISSNVMEVVRPRRAPDDQIVPVILEYQWPSTAIVNAPIPRSARGIAWMVTSMVVVLIAVMGFIPTDQVVTARGIVISKTPTILAQPLDTAIVRSIDVHEGQFVRAGAVLAHFDPTVAAADMRALQAEVASLKAEVERLQAQAQDKPYTAAAGDPASTMQAEIYAHDQAAFQLKLQSYKQKIGELSANVARAEADVKAFRGRLSGAQSIETMRKQLESEGFGSHLNTVLAVDARLEMERSLADASQSAQAARRDLAAMQDESDAYVQSGSGDISQKLSDATRKLSDATQQLNKARLHRDFAELHTDRDAIVQSIAKVSVGSVLQSGEPFITLVPADAPLEIEANVSGSDNGFVHVGDRVEIKFDTFPFSQYGMADGNVRMVSPDSFTAQSETHNPTGAVPLPAASAEPFYRARIAIERTALHGTSPRGSHRTWYARDGRHQGRKTNGTGLSARPRYALRDRRNARAVTMQTAQRGAEHRALWPVAVVDRLLSLVSPKAAFRRAIGLSERGKIVKAFPLLVRAAKAGIAEAEYKVARCYLQGMGVPASRTEGARWLQGAAEHGHVEAQSQLAGLYVHGLAGAALDIENENTEKLFETETPAKPDFVSALVGRVGLPTRARRQVRRCWHLY